MSNESLDSAVEIVKSFYIDNNFEIPNNVVQYIANFPKGYSRQAIQNRYNLTCAEFVKLLNPSYEKPKNAIERLKIEAIRLGYKVLSDSTLIKNNRSLADLECINCGFTHTTTITSLSGSLLGCPRCRSGNLPWYKRSEELDQLLLDNFNAIRISEIPTSQLGYLKVLHKPCGNIYESQLVGLVSPNTELRGTCPNCRNTDRRIVADGVTFGSKFEYECYDVIRTLNPELHVKYQTYFNTNRKWVCDFKINKYWIEVSNFKQDFKHYFNNIEEKQQLVESNGHEFFFVRTLPEMKELYSIMKI